MIVRRHSKFQIVLGLILALAVLGSALHLHPHEDLDNDTPCVICYFLAFWLPAVLIVIAVIYCRQLTVDIIFSSVFEPQPIPFVRPPLRASPLCRG